MGSDQKICTPSWVVTSKQCPLWKVEWHVCRGPPQKVTFHHPGFIASSTRSTIEDTALQNTHSVSAEVICIVASCWCEPRFDIRRPQQMLLGCQTASQPCFKQSNPHSAGRHWHTVVAAQFDYRRDSLELKFDLATLWSSSADHTSTNPALNLCRCVLWQWPTLSSRWGQVACSLPDDSSPVRPSQQHACLLVSII